MRKANEIGRPPKYPKPELLREAVNKYLEKPPVKIHTTADGTEFEVPNITITGLCWYLGFESRQSFYDLEKREDFSYIVKRARLFIECDYETLLKANSCAGAIFALKNMGWSDRQEIENISPNEPMHITFTVAPPVDEIIVTNAKDDC